MASNLAIARGAASFIPPSSLGFWRWTLVFFLIVPFFYKPIIKNFRHIRTEFFKLFFLGFTGCCLCSIFPYVAGQTTTVLNMSLIYTSSSIFIVILSTFFYKEKINFLQGIGFLLAFIGVLVVISNGKFSTFLNDFNNIEQLVDYFDDFSINLKKKTLNFFLKSVISP